MIRLGEIVKGDKNQLMNVSAGNERLVRKLSIFDFGSVEDQLLGCLTISQTEKQYKNYLIKVLTGLSDGSEASIQQLIEIWQEADLTLVDEDYRFLISANEASLLETVSLEEHLEDKGKAYQGLFVDGLSNVFYPTRKKSTVYLRRLVLKHLRDPGLSQDEFRKLVTYFCLSQLLASWESTCIHLGLMLLNEWKIRETSSWFCQVWPVYYED